MSYVLPVLKPGARVGRWDAWDPLVDEVIRTIQNRWSPHEKSFPKKLREDIDGALWLTMPRNFRGRLTKNANHNPDYLPHTAAAAAAYDAMVRAAQVSESYKNWRDGKFPQPGSGPEWCQLENEHATDVAAMHAALVQHGTGTETVRAILSLWKLVVVTNAEQKSLPKCPDSFDFSQSSWEAKKYVNLAVLPPRRDWWSGQELACSPVSVPAPATTATAAAAHKERPVADDKVLAELASLRLEVRTLTQNLVSLLSHLTKEPEPLPGPWQRFLAWFRPAPPPRRVSPEVLKRIILQEAQKARPVSEN